VSATAPTPAQLQALLAAMIARLMRLFVRRGVVVGCPSSNHLRPLCALAEGESAPFEPKDGSL
jgi:hypothetical protein